MFDKTAVLENASGMTILPETSEYIQATRFLSRLLEGGIGFSPLHLEGEKAREKSLPR